MTVLVLDDDPTGTQCAADVPVLLRPTGLGSLPPTSAYVLTNTRAMDAADAAALVRDIRDRAGPGADLVLRGDSTLRGHVFAEMTALGLDRGAGLVVPAFPAAGRVTIDGVHWLETGDGPVNVADTEFAQDPVFGFTARTMRDWVAEVGGSRGFASTRPLAGDVRDALLRVPDGGVVVPDVARDDDLRAIAGGLAAARAAGRYVVVRCAAPFAARLAGVRGRLVAAPPVRRPGLLIVCGSHTLAATDQLAELTLEPVVLPTDAFLGADRSAPARAVDSVVAAGLAQLAAGGVAVVTTERVRRAEHGRLADGAAVMAGLTAVVRRLGPHVGAIVTKGGITSAAVATNGLGGAIATVLGQVETGVPLWEVAGKPVAVVPGNIGDAGTLVRMLRYFGAGDPT